MRNGWSLFRNESIIDINANHYIYAIIMSLLVLGSILSSNSVTLSVLELEQVTKVGARFSATFRC